MEGVIIKQEWCQPNELDLTEGNYVSIQTSKGPLVLCNVHKLERYGNTVYENHPVCYNRISFAYNDNMTKTAEELQKEWDKQF